MREEDWATLAIFVWLSAYMVFFAGSCVILRKKATIPRKLIFTGTLILVVINLLLLAEYLEITNMQYHPMYEDESYRNFLGEHPYPAWQRYYYWGAIALDLLGKILAGAGLIAEGRQQIAILRYRQMQLYQPQPTNHS